MVSTTTDKEDCNVAKDIFNTGSESPYDSMNYDTGNPVEFPAAKKIDPPQAQKTGGASLDLMEVFKQASLSNNVPMNVLMALGEQESNFNPKAIGVETKWGTAKGIMQYLDPTAKSLGINPFDPVQSINAAAKQLRQRLDKGMSMEDAVMEHFAGTDRSKWGAKTSQYGRDVMAKAYAIAEQFGGMPPAPDRSGQEPAPLTLEEQKNWRTDRAILPDQSNQSQWSEIMRKDPDAYQGEQDGFFSATGKALRNVPTQFNDAGGGIIREFGENMDDRSLYYSAQDSGVFDKMIANGDIVMKNGGGLTDHPTPYLKNGQVAGISEVANFLRQNAEQYGLKGANGEKPSDITKFGQEVSKNANKEMLKINPDGTVAKYGSQIIAGTANMLPAIIATAVTKNPSTGMGIILGQVKGSAYNQARDDQDHQLNPQQASYYAAFQGLAESLTEKIPLGVIMKEGGNGLKAYLRSFGAEGIQEGVTQLINDGLDSGSITPDMTLEQALVNLRDSAIVGGGVGLGMKASYDAANRMRGNGNSDNGNGAPVTDNSPEHQNLVMRDAINAMNPDQNAQPVSPRQERAPYTDVNQVRSRVAEFENSVNEPAIQQQEQPAADPTKPMGNALRTATTAASVPSVDTNGNPSQVQTNTPVMLRMDGEGDTQGVVTEVLPEGVMFRDIGGQSFLIPHQYIANGTVQFTTQAEQPPAQQKPVKDMTVPELTGRMNELKSLARESGWTSTLLSERDQIENALDKIKQAEIYDNEDDTGDQFTEFGGSNNALNTEAQPEDEFSPNTESIAADQPSQQAGSEAIDRGNETRSTGYAGIRDGSVELEQPVREDQPSINEDTNEQPSLTKDEPQAPAQNEILGADGARKWFGSKPKAIEFINKKGLADTHDAVKNGAKWEITPKETKSKPTQNSGIDINSAATESIESISSGSVNGIVYDPNLKSEAEAGIIDGKIRVGKKFFDLDTEARKHVLKHEINHRVAKKIGEMTAIKMANAGYFGDLTDEGTIKDGINGVNTPDEALTESLTVYHENPIWLKERFPHAYKAIDSYVKNGTISNEIMDDIEQKSSARDQELKQVSANTELKVNQLKQIYESLDDSAEKERIGQIYATAAITGEINSEAQSVLDQAQQQTTSAPSSKDESGSNDDATGSQQKFSGNQQNTLNSIDHVIDAIKAGDERTPHFIQKINSVLKRNEEFPHVVDAINKRIDASGVRDQFDHHSAISKNKEESKAPRILSGLGFEKVGTNEYGDIGVTETYINKETSQRVKLLTSPRGQLFNVEGHDGFAFGMKMPSDALEREIKSHIHKYKPIANESDPAPSEQPEQLDQQKPTRTQRRQEAAKKNIEKAASAIGGVSKGEKVKITGKVGYAGDGIYTVNSISPSGEISVTNESGASTMLSKADIVRAQKSGTTFEPVSDTGKYTGKTIEQLNEILLDKRYELRQSRKAVRNSIDNGNKEIESIALNREREIRSELKAIEQAMRDYHGLTDQLSSEEQSQYKRLTEKYGKEHADEVKAKALSAYDPLARKQAWTDDIDTAKVLGNSNQISESEKTEKVNQAVKRKERLVSKLQNSDVVQNSTGNSFSTVDDALSYARHLRLENTHYVEAGGTNARGYDGYYLKKLPDPSTIGTYKVETFHSSEKSRSGMGMNVSYPVLIGGNVDSIRAYAISAFGYKTINNQLKITNEVRKQLDINEGVMIPNLDTFIDRVKRGNTAEPQEQQSTPDTKGKETSDHVIGDKQAHELPLDQWVEQEFKKNDYYDEYQNDPELAKGIKDDLEKAWYDGLNEQAKKGRISDDALDSFVENNGIDQLLHNFRGVKEAGIKGYEQPQVRLFDKTYAQVRKMKSDGKLGGIRDVKPFHREMIKQAIKDGKSIPDSVMKDYPELATVKPIESVKTETGNPDLYKVISVFSKDPSFNEARNSQKEQQAVYETIKQVRGLDDAYRFQKWLDSSFQSDRDKAIQIAKDAYAELDKKQESRESLEQQETKAPIASDYPNASSYHAAMSKYKSSLSRSESSDESNASKLSKLNNKIANAEKRLKNKITEASKPNVVPPAILNEAISNIQKEISDLKSERDALVNSEPSKTSKLEVSNNTTFTDDMRDAAVKRLLSKRGTLYSGIDPEILQDGITLAGWHIEKGIRTFAAYAKAMTEILGNEFKPYLKSWYAGIYFDPRAAQYVKDMTPLAEVNDFNLDEITTNEPNTARDMESDRPADADAVGTGFSETDNRGDFAEQESIIADDLAKGRTEPKGGSSIPAYSPFDAGTSSNQSMDRTDGEPRSEIGTTGDVDARGNNKSGGRGIQSKKNGRTELLRQTEQRDQRLDDGEKNQAEADNIPVKLGDLDNIKSTLPILTAEQHDDVHGIEQRLYVDNGKGKLITNGTGTGKGHLLIGAAKRVIMRGGNVLVVSPASTVEDLMGRAKTMNMEPHQLKDKKDAGVQGINFTSYQNFADNQELLKRNFDLVAYDEAHKLMANMDGSATVFNNAHKALTGHPDFITRRGEYILKEQYEQLKADEEAAIAKLVKKGVDPVEAINKVYDTGVFQKRRDKLNAEAARIGKELADEGVDTKVLFFSASPFAGHKTVFYGDGYLFNSGDGASTNTGYNVGNAQAQYLVKNFGYRMKYNKVTVPEAEVDVGLLERDWADKMFASGAMSGRTLKLPFDYSREFAVVNSGLGQKLDDAFAAINYKSYPKLSSQIAEWRKGGTDMLLLESLRAIGSIERIRKHLALGRKLVIFHERQELNIPNPFNFKADSDEAKAEIAALRSAHPWIFDIKLDGLKSAPDILRAEFGDEIAFFSGRQDKKTRNKDLADFNSDTGTKKIILIQKDSGKEGLSAHDITGKSQRVLMILNTPKSPADAIQMEGRIYRFGLKSNAIIEYPTIQTSFEKYAYRNTVSSRTSTAENLAMGTQARNLKDAFREGYLNPTELAPHGKQGTGGVASDKRTAGITQFERAKTYYFQRQKKTSKNKSAEGADYFATPEPIGLKMVELARLEGGERALEPSAGHGAIARWFPESVEALAIEQSPKLAAELAVGVDAEVRNMDFEDLNKINKYHAIVMNPPFGVGGSMAMPHIEKAFDHLKDGGRIVAIIPEGKMTERLDKWLEGNSRAHLVGDFSLPTSTFGRAGTGVKTRMIIIDRDNKGKRAYQGTVRRDLSRHQDINELFDAVNLLTSPDRPNVVVTARDVGMDEDIRSNDEGLSQYIAEASEFSSGDYGLLHKKDAKKLAERFGGELESGDSSFWKSYKYVFESEKDRGRFFAAVQDAAEKIRNESRSGRYSIKAEGITSDDVYVFAKELEQSSGAKSLSLYLDNTGKTLKLQSLIIDKANQRQGTGTNIMNQIAKFADQHGLRVTLTAGLPTDHLGTTSKARLVKFYKRFGFVENKGRNKDFSVSDGMIREPKGNYSINQLSSNPKFTVQDRLNKNPVTKLLMNTGKVIIHADSSTIPSARKDGVQGYTDSNGTIHLVEWLANPEGVLLHEAFHSGAQSLIGDKRWNNLIDRLNRMYQSNKSGNSAFWREAADRVEIAGIADPRLAAEEFGAYAIEQYESAPAGVKKFLDSLLGTVKDWAFRRFGVQLGDVTGGQLRSMAQHALRHLGVNNPANFRDNGVYSVARPQRRASPDELNSWFSRKLTNNMDTVLALAPLDRLIQDIGEKIPALQKYLKFKREMDAYRNHKHIEFDKIATQWLSFNVFHHKHKQALMDLMHDSTIAQIDPSHGYTPSLDLDVDADEHEQKYQDLHDRYQALPEAGKKMFNDVRDAYLKQSAELDQIILDNMEKALEIGAERARRAHEDKLQEFRDDGLTGEELRLATERADKALNNALKKAQWSGAARILRMRRLFESNRLKGIYFPLARFGKFFVSVRDSSGALVEFRLFESSDEQNKFMRDLDTDNYDVDYGMMKDSKSEVNKVNPNFVADVEDILNEADAPDEIKDQIWQRYLETLPELSIRKKFKHRKNTAGYSEDALRAFASHMFHASHQMAKAKYGFDLQNQLEVAEREAKNTTDKDRAHAVVNEVVKRHSFVMNPTGGSAAQAIASTAFIWNLGADLSSGVANLTQTTIIAPAVIGAWYGKGGVRGTTLELARATKQFMGTVVKRKAFWRASLLDSNAISGEEKQALAWAYDIGLIDKTNSHNLAGVADTGVKYSVWRDKIMGMFSVFFHHAERFNREVTFLAAYRMAKKKDATMGREKLSEVAADLTWKTHFNYDNTNRPRFMQSDTAKVLLIHRNYSVNMLYRMGRDLHQAVRGETKEKRAAALKTFGAITASMALHAGIRGTWLYGAAMLIASMLFGDDAEEQMKKGVIESLGSTVGGMLLNGIPSHLTGADISARVGMPDLWFRSPDQQLEGQAEFQYWVMQTLGASVGMLYNQYKGISMVTDGNYYRGIETLSPKFIKSAMRAARYEHEGARTLDGDPLLTDMPTGDPIRQLLGFTPMSVSERYDLNNAAKRMQVTIKRDYQRNLNTYMMALKQGDTELMNETLSKMIEFGKKYPAYMPTQAKFKQSARARMLMEQRSKGGVYINPKLEDVINSQLPPAIYDNSTESDD